MRHHIMVVRILKREFHVGNSTATVSLGIPLSFCQIGMMVVKNMAPMNNVNKIMGVKIFQTGHSA